MARNRFVSGDVVRLPLSDGDFIDVKKELNAGEGRGIYTSLVKEMHFGEKATLDPQQVGLTKILAYIVGWSFVGADSKPVPFSASALNNLDAETYAEIETAIDAHEAAIEKARAERKNGRAGESTLNPISPLLDA